MRYSFHPEAQNELNIAIDYYEEFQKGLGLDFANEVYNAIQRIINFPYAWQKIDKNLRRCLVNRFPYGIIYYKRDNEIVILAVMHLQKKPNYWRDRKTKK